jgi:hypothetical protein
MFWTVCPLPLSVDPYMDQPTNPVPARASGLDHRNVLDADMPQTLGN